MFQYHVRRLITQTSPEDMCRNKINYILINKRWKSSCKNAKILPDAEYGSNYDGTPAEATRTKEEDSISRNENNQAKSTACCAETVTVKHER